MRQQSTRKVTLTKGGPQQPQHLPVGPHMYPAIPPGIKSIQGIHPAKKVLRWKGPVPCSFLATDGEKLALSVFSGAC